MGQIKPENVGELQQLCSLDLNAVSWFSSGLLMVGGKIYVNTIASTFAVDATSCALLWHHDISFTRGWPQCPTEVLPIWTGASSAGRPMDA